MFQKGVLSVLILISILIVPDMTHAAGLLTPINDSNAKLDIHEHHVDVVIEDGYAITTVTQVFFNPQGHDLEAIYSFPVPNKAAVSEFTVWIDSKPIVGEVLEKKQA
ncbi:MAG: hypothetical protein GY935_13825, partial [Gammaproteobacteria bacterium]|nr:hypothetical protein [Gammaproteobacteria bacterium]